MPTEQERADLSRRRGQTAAGIKDSDQRRKFVAAQGETDRKGGGDSEYAGLNQSNQNEQNKQALGGMLGSMKHGGTVHKTGPYLLHEGETVVPKDKAMSKKNSKPKHGIKHTHIEHHTDKSHTIRHSMMDGSEQSAATPDDAGMLEHMTDAMGSEAPAPAPADAAAPMAAQA
jgi:hypothetical protein